MDPVIDPLEEREVPVPVSGHARRRRPPFVDHQQVGQARRGHLVGHGERQLDGLPQRELARQRTLELVEEPRVRALVAIRRLEQRDAVVGAPVGEMAPEAVDQIVAAARVLPAPQQVPTPSRERTARSAGSRTSCAGGRSPCRAWRFPLCARPFFYENGGSALFALRLEGFKTRFAPPDRAGPTHGSAGL